MIDYLALPVPFLAALIVNAVNIYLYTRFFRDVKTSRGVRSVLIE